MSPAAQQAVGHAKSSIGRSGSTARNVSSEKQIDSGVPLNGTASNEGVALRLVERVQLVLRARGNREAGQGRLQHGIVLVLHDRKFGAPPTNTCGCARCWLAKFCWFEVISFKDQRSERKTEIAWAASTTAGPFRQPKLRWSTRIRYRIRGLLVGLHLRFRMVRRRRRRLRLG